MNSSVTKLAAAVEQCQVKSRKWTFPNSYNKSQSKDHNDLKSVAQKAVEALQ